MRVQRAHYEHKSASLNSEWGYKVACEKFGKELVDKFPTYSRGPRKGKLKGHICWTKCEVGGWCHNLPGNGGAGVLLPGTIGWRLLAANPYADVQEHSTVARWHQGTVERLQEPTAAEQMFKDYGAEKRYG